MTKLNNFDTSSQGVNLELSVYYDNHLARIFDEEFSNGADGYQVLQFEGRRSISYIVIGTKEDLELPYFTRRELENYTKDELLDFSYNIGNGLNDNYSKEDIIEDLLQYCDNETYYKWHFENTNWRDLDSDTTVTGYSQGDVIKVKAIGFDITSSYAQHLQDIFYNSPVQGILSIDDSEVCIDEVLECTYTYDKDDVLQKLAEYDIIKNHSKKEYILNWLKDNLPQYPDYL